MSNTAGTHSFIIHRLRHLTCPVYLEANGERGSMQYRVNSCHREPQLTPQHTGHHYEASAEGNVLTHVQAHKDTPVAILLKQGVQWHRACCPEDPQNTL